MDFNFTDEQKQFSESLRRFIEKDYGLDARKKIIHSPQGVSDEVWNTLVELGVTALPVPEAQGGFNGNAVDMMVVMQEIGRGLVVEPYFATMTAARALTLSGNQADALEKVASGDLRMALAVGERQSRHDFTDVATRAARATDASSGYVIDGEKAVVLHGAQAGMLVVSARTSGEQRSAAGISLFFVPVDAQGVEMREYRTVDGQRAADVRFSRVAVPASALLGSEGAGWELLEAVLDYGVTLLCAEAVGAMEALNQSTLEYLKTRQQFGVPIGKFQALQHRMVDMFIHMEQARALATLAAVKVDVVDAAERRRVVSAAKVRVGRACRYVGQQAIQLHGGMGVTDEMAASHYFKRLTMIELSLGDTDHHLARFASQPEFSQAQ